MSAATAYQPTPEIAHLVWIQGQADGAAHPSPATYQEELSTVLGSFYDHFSVYDTSIETIATAIAGDGVPNTHPEDDWIRWGGMAEAASLRAEGKRAFYVDGLDAVLSNDDIHPSQTIGAINLATDFYRALAYGTSETSLMITGATLAGETITLSVKNAGSTLSLTGPDTIASLFTAYPTGVHTGQPVDQLPIVDGAIKDAHTITLTLSEAPATNVDLYYREPDDADFGTAATTITNDVTEGDFTSGQQLALPSATITTTGQPDGAMVKPGPANLTLDDANIDTGGAKFGDGSIAGGFGFAEGVVPRNGIFTLNAWIKREPLTAPIRSSEFILNDYLPIGFGANGFNLSGVNCMIGSEPHECLSGAYGNNSSYYFSGTFPIDDGVWHDVAVTSTGGSMIVYLDGRAVSSAPSFAGGGGELYDSSTLVLGALTVQGTDPWGGEIDEVQVLSNATTSDFTPATAAAVPGPNTVELWHLDNDGTDTY